MEKLVSVFINAYNSEKFILETVNSVLNQTYKNIQLVVIDDCSDDSTYELLQTVNDNRLELYKNDVNMGISYTCNRGIEACRGEYIAHTDSDDTWAPDKIEKQLRFLEENSEYGACFSHADIIDANSNLCNEQYSELKSIYAMHNLPQTEMFRYFIEHSNRFCHSAVLARSSIVQKIGSHRLSTRYLHDFDYWLRMIMICKVYIIQEPLAFVRVHGGNNSSMNEKKWIAHDNELLYILDNAVENCPDELFLQAFNDKLRLKGEHTHEETQLEKAFYSIDNIYRFKDNPILGINRLMRLFDCDKKYIELAVKKFNFNLKDLNNLQTNRLYYDTVLINDQKSAIDNLLKIKEDQESAYKQLEKILKDKNKEIKELGDLVATEQNNVNRLNQSIKSLHGNIDSLQNEINDFQNELTNSNNRYNLVVNSLSWKITAPLRKIHEAFKKH